VASLVVVLQEAGLASPQYLAQNHAAGCGTLKGQTIDDRAESLSDAE